jgi:ferredoxin--NADP+ reductase
LEVDDTDLVLQPDGDTKARRMGTHFVLDVDTVIFCIGDRVSERLGLPVQWNSFVKHPDPAYPVDGISFVAYDPDACRAIEGVFIAGWARKASKGQVGLARKDARECVEALTGYLDACETLPGPERAREALQARLRALDKPIITKDDVARLAEAEAAEAELRGDPTFKFTTNEAMLAAIG